MLNIYYPIPKNYTNPGPVGLHLHRRFVWLTLFPGCLARIDDAASSVLVLMSHARLYIIAHSSALRSHSAIGRICTASSVLYNVIFHQVIVSTPTLGVNHIPSVKKIKDDFTRLSSASMLMDLSVYRTRE